MTFIELGIIVIAATLMGAAAVILRQPIILAYILAGIILGPALSSSMVATLSELGIAFLLFIVGLEIDLRKLKSLGSVVLVAGACQIGSTFALGFLASSLLGFAAKDALYLGIAIAFSSTMIVVKLLSDKRELDTFHGRIILGVLLLQDLVAVLVLAALPNIGSPAILIIGLLKGLLLFAVAIISRFIFQELFRLIARSQELLFLASLSWCFAMASLASFLDYSLAIGAFLAGISLASLSYNLEIISKVKSLRDFFALLFFVSLGMQVTGISSGLLLPAILLSAVVIFWNPLIITLVGCIFGFKKRTAFLSGIALTQISEFSLIVVALGLKLGDVSQDIVTIVTMVGAITLVATSYLIKYDSEIYLMLSRALGIFDRLNPKRHEEELPGDYQPDVVLCGYNRIGYSILNTLLKLKKKLLVVDYNPELIHELHEASVPCIYGDVGDLEIIERMQISSARMLISTVPDLYDNLLLIKKAREKNKNLIVILTASQIDDALQLYSSGADYVILPHFLGGQHISLMLVDFSSDLSTLMTEKLRHIDELNKRKSLGHEHPLHS